MSPGIGDLYEKRAGLGRTHTHPPPPLRDLLDIDPAATFAQDDAIVYDASRRLWVPLPAATAAEIADLDAGAESAGTDDTYARGGHKHAIAFGASTAYTPSWTASGTAPAIGNGSLNGWYIRLGKLLIVRLDMQLGSTTTQGTGQWRFHLPAGMSPTTSGIRQTAIGQGRNVGTATEYIEWEIADDPYFAAKAGGTNSDIGPGIPFTWGSGDNLTIGPVIIELA
jgi:hypothetical protein